MHKKKGKGEIYQYKSEEFKLKTMYPKMDGRVSRAVEVIVLKLKKYRKWVLEGV